MQTRSFMIVLTTAVLLLAVVPAKGQVLLDENFEYANDAALGAAWTRSSTNFALNATGFDPGPTALATVAYNGTTTNTTTGVSKLARFNNAAYATKSLSSAVTADTAWSIKFSVGIETFSRNGGIGLLNAATGAGYTVKWDASNPNQSTGRGIITINERSAGALLAQNYGTAFTNGRRPSYTDGATYGTWPSGTPTFSFASNGNSYHPVTGYRIDVSDGTTNTNSQTYSTTFSGLAQFELVYTPAYSRTGASGPESGARLALYLTGPGNPDATTPIFDVVDISPFATNFSFDQLYLTGASTDFDNVFVALPEPASIGLLGSAACLLLGRRRARQA